MTTPTPESGASSAWSGAQHSAATTPRLVGIQAVDQVMSKTLESFTRLGDHAGRMADRMKAYSHPTTGIGGAGATSAGVTQQSAGAVGIGGNVTHGASAWLAQKIAGAGAVALGGMTPTGTTPGTVPGAAPGTPAAVAAGNGGGSTFSGVAGGAHAAANTARWYTPPGMGGTTLRQPSTWTTGQQVAYGGTAAAVGAMAGYVGSTATDTRLMQAVAAQSTVGSNWNQTSDAMFLNQNRSAQSTADAVQAQAIGQTLMPYQQLNQFGQPAAQYQSFMAGASSASAVNPMISQTESLTSQAALSSMNTFNQLRPFGIDTYKNGKPVPQNEIARQILRTIDPKKSISTERQMGAILAPNGHVEISLTNMVAEGRIPPESRNAIRANIEAQLKGQIQGVSAKQINKLVNQSDQGGEVGTAAHDQLEDLGIQNTIVGDEQRKAAAKRDTTVHALEGLTWATKTTTGWFEKLNTALSQFADKVIPEGGPSWWGDFKTDSSKANSWLAKKTDFLPGVDLDLPDLNMSVGNPFGGAAPTMSRAGFSGTAMRAGGLGGSAPTMSRGDGGMSPAMAVMRGRGIGGQSSGGQSGNRSGDGKGGGGGGGGNANSGVSFIAPRPGVDNLGPEGDFGTRTIGQGWHTGIDLDGGTGAPIKASAGGKVIAAGWAGRPDRDSGYGNCVTIDHGGGFKTLYCHMAGVAVGRGDEVRQGQNIGGVGDTGSYSQGSHLHFELWVNGKPVDPVPYLKGRRAPISGNTSSGSGKPGDGHGPGGSGASGSKGSNSEGVSYSVGGAATAGVGYYSQAGFLGLSSGVLTAAMGFSGGTSQSSGSGASGKDEAGSGSSGSAGPSGSASIAGSFGSGASGTWKSLMSTGYFSKQQAAGVMGNIQSESGFDPLIVQGGGRSMNPENISVGYGLVQWTPGSKLAPYLHGKDPSIATEVNALVAQLRGVGPSAEAAAGAALRKTKTPGTAARVFGLQYERYAGPPQDIRETQAEAWFKKFAGGKSRASGAWNLAFDEEVRTHRGEMILPANIAAIVRSELTAPGSRGRGDSSPAIVFDKGAIQVSVNGAINEREARMTGHQIVDAVMDDKRMHRLAMGV